MATDTAWAEMRETPLQPYRAALGHLSRLLAITPKPWWSTPVVVVLGLATSFAETLGITLIILFFYSVMDQLEAATMTSGVLGEALTLVSGWFHTPLLMAAVILLLIIARAGLSYANSLIGAVVGEQINERVRNAIHRQYLFVSYAFMQRYEQAQLMTVLGTESWLVAGAYASLTRIYISGCSVLVFGLFLVLLSWQITLVAAIGSLIIAFGLRRLARPARDLGDHVKGINRRLAEQMLMTLEGLRTIRAYGQEDVHQQRFLRSSAESCRTSIALTRLSSLLTPLTEIGYLGILCVIVAGYGWWGATFATTLAAVALLYRLQPHFKNMESNLLYLAQIEPQLRSVLAMLRTDDKDYPEPGHLPFERVRQGIRFDRVSFVYPDAATPALRDVSFTIPAGARTVLIGGSGAGKTTVINLLLRLYEPTSGTIWVDGKPLREIRRGDWLGRLAVAGQDVDLVEGTVIDNIRMARNSATDEEVITASGIAGIADFIETLPDGYATWVGQQGLRFSGGQRQRLGLARAMLRHPDLLLLDEAMSALDLDLERSIAGAIDKHLPDRTVLVVTHRTETIATADAIVRLEDGRVVAADQS